jgi:hypothetical protein
MVLAPTVQPILWGKMLADLLRSATRLGVLAALGLACGCSLNPQPLPPGAAPEGGGAGEYVDATAGGDGGNSFGPGDAAPRVDATADGTPGIPPEGGDAAADAGGDGSGDAAVDGPEDGPSDGGSEDGE